VGSVIDMTDHEHCLDKGECWRVHVPGSDEGANEHCPSLSAERRTDDDGKPISAMTQCGVCLRWWDDAIVTSMTPVPAGRCPFEYDHPSTELESAVSDTLTLTFSSDASTGTYAAVFSALEGWTIDIERTNDGYPDEGVVKEADEIDGLTVYEADDNGGPIVNSTYCIPWEVLTKVTIR
jgi:hypothetical protein